MKRLLFFVIVLCAFTRIEAQQNKWTLPLIYWQSDSEKKVVVSYAFVFNYPATRDAEYFSLDMKKDFAEKVFTSAFAETNNLDLSKGKVYVSYFFGNEEFGNGEKKLYQKKDDGYTFIRVKYKYHPKSY